MKPTTQPYDSGLLTISRTGNIASPGEKPVKGPVARYTGIAYAERTVGISRFWQGLQQDVRIARLLRCPRLPGVSALDIVTTEDGQTYQIEQIQYPANIEPASMDLSLTLILADEDVPADQGDGETNDS